MRVDDLPLPQQVIEMLKNSGYMELYPPQEEAVKAGLLNGRNLIVASPTASGKTLIALIAACYHIYEEIGKVIYLVPLRALASEKYEEFKVLEELRKKSGKYARIKISTGDYDTTGEELKRADMIIATNEKMDSLVRHGPSWLNQVSLVVADETHLIDSVDRGPTLEILLTRIIKDFPNVQILMLSATISNASEFSKWANADVILTDWRPVPLREGVFFNGVIHFKNGEVRKIREVTGKPVVDITLETLNKGGHVLIFTSTRNEAVRMARKISERLSTSLSLGRKILHERRRLEEISSDILASGEKTKLSEILASLVRRGVAFHHAGLPSTHRKIVENAFRDGWIKVLTATPTLAAGVNLPSRTVIITYHERWSMGFREPLTVFEYKQMAGRAGRPQYDKFGEAILVARKRDELEYLQEMYVDGEIERLTSKLDNEDVLQTHVLGLIVSKRRQKYKEILEFFTRTLYSIQNPPSRIIRRVDKALSILRISGLIERVDDAYVPTAFGRRVAELYISPSTGIVIKEILLKHGRSIVYPIDHLYMICSTADMVLFPLYKKDLKKLEEKVAKCRSILLSESQFREYEYSRYEILQTVKTAFVLRDWIEEKTEDEILTDWKVEPGDLNTATYTAEWLLYSASQISRLLGEKDRSGEFLRLTARVKHGVKEELLEIVKLEGVGRIRGRLLYEGGYKTLLDLNRASVEDLRRIPGIGEKLAESIKKQLRSADMYS